VCIKVQWEDRDAQDLVDMTQHELAIEDESTLDRPRVHVHEDDEEDVSRARRRIRWRITPPATAPLGRT
jgi:hypothetical protein